MLFDQELFKALWMGTAVLALIVVAVLLICASAAARWLIQVAMAGQRGSWWEALAGQLRHGRQPTADERHQDVDATSRTVGEPPPNFPGT
jgi:hypothetical protein